jgi:hypothetical protein
MGRPVIIFDTTVINRFAEDRKAAGPLIAGLKSGYTVRLTATNVDEIIATHNAGERDQLLDVCREFLESDSTEIIRPFHELTGNLIVEFEKRGSCDWERVPLRLPEYEREVALQELIDDELSNVQREHAAQAKAEFEAVFCNARPHFEEIFKAGTEARPSSVAELVSRLQVKGGAFWGFGMELYERPANRRPHEETIRRFVDSCPPFHALLLALCVAQYDRCIRELQQIEPFAGRNDLFMSVYLPYCDEFVSDDRGQQRCLREVASLAKLPVKVCWFREFRDRFSVNLSAPVTRRNQTISRSGHRE